jgi:uncharacterized protein
VITDLVQIKRAGEKQRPENLRFRSHLKTHGFVERRLRRIAQDVEEQIDCTTCANCCRVATTTITARDVADLSRFLRLREAEFLAQYTVEDPEEGLILKRTADGCIFLENNLCRVYEHRPRTCVNFPHMVRGEGSIESRMWQMVDRACYCPIVFNTLDAWKEDTGFRR